MTTLPQIVYVILHVTVLGPNQQNKIQVEPRVFETEEKCNLALSEEIGLVGVALRQCVPFHTNGYITVKPTN